MALRELKKTAGDGGDFELPPEGQQAAMLVAIIDLGTQTISLIGKPPKETAKVAFVWELLENKQADGSPYLLVVDYTPSLDERSHLSKLIKAWVGRTIKDDETYDYCALAKDGGLLGRYCYVTLEHAESKSGKKDKDGKPRKFARIIGVSGVHKDARASVGKLRPQTALLKWEVETAEVPALASTLYSYGQKLSDVIAGAIERGGRRATQVPQGPPPQYDVAGTAKGATSNDDIPW